MGLGRFWDEVYRLFENKISFDDFTAKVKSLPDEKKFAGACFSYKQALKCEKCEPNVAILLLCTCADAIKITNKKAPRENFIRFYQTYCPSELKGNMPIERYDPRGEPQPSKASFEEALHLIYERFRNPLVHEAKRWFEQFSPEDYESLQKWAKMGVPISICETSRIEAFEKDSKATLYYGDKMYYIDINKLLDWFKKATLESLYNFLMEKSEPIKE